MCLRSESLFRLFPILCLFTMKKYLNLFDLSQKVDYKTEVLSGLTVALALVPEAVAFALIAGLSPLTGLYAAFVMGLVTAVLGGRPGMISGATGAVAVVIVSLAQSHGVEYVFATVVLAGALQIGAGFLRLGKLMRLVPHPVIFWLRERTGHHYFYVATRSVQGRRRRVAHRPALVHSPGLGTCHHVYHLGPAQTQPSHSGLAGGDP